MSFETILKGLIRSGPRAGDDREVALSQDGDLITAGGAAPYSETTRRGGTWNAISAAATPLVVIPSTLCIQELFNNTADQVMEIQDLFLFHLLGTAALHNVSLWAQVTVAKDKPGIASTITIGSQSGRAPYVAVANSDVVPAAGTTVISSGWRPWGQPGPGVVSTALPGEAFSVSVEGKLLVPPRSSLCVTAVDSIATASSVRLGASWALRKMTAN